VSFGCTMGLLPPQYAGGKKQKLLYYHKLGSSGSIVETNLEKWENGPLKF
jgi:hypothetical protein